MNQYTTLKGDQEFESYIDHCHQETNKLLKLLITIYDQKNLAIKFQELGGEFCEISREKLNRWKADPVANPISLGDSSLKKLRSTLLPKKPAHWDNPNFTFIDLFAGIGGLRKGFENVGGKCVFTSEWDEKARRTYLANHYVDESELPYFLNNEQEDGAKNTSFMDITQITLSGDPEATELQQQASILKHIPKHDVLLAGFPCQPFSLAGVSKKNSLGRAHGFECDTQGTLFFDVQKVLEARQPKYFVLENVKNLKSHDKGKTFATIIRTLDQVGYWVADITDVDSDIEEAIKVVRKRKPEPTIIDGMNFTPQHRERIVLVGVRKDLVEKNPEYKKLSLKNIEVPQKRLRVSDILTNLSEEETKKYTLTPNLWNYLYHYALKHQSKGNGFGFGLVDPSNPNAVTRTLSARYYKDGSEILINHQGLSEQYLADNREHGFRKNKERLEFSTNFADRYAKQNPECTEKQYKEMIKEGEAKYDQEHGRYAPEFDPLYKTPRRLTPRECARLMGFEDVNDPYSEFRIVCADAPAYKQFGNSVVVPVFSAVAKLLTSYM
ncbi:DNA (cytosine-5-)-methyltransferase [Vibrio alginolyticus]|uniref:DNA (cytosine-5-)-methyltransferase n=1 Tax=Vibrio parahaemolyticus TaxID=670 RepID=UPI00084B6271|nr:DNA (cytosine-5-)-methyltransferase [Vibrio parahaemolyticus]EGQ9769970.1 DNA (cytosine-5-)-methyltransferase [Vibrio alginolyticus]ODX68841.1 DNA (cytosine-5-)-methyltransferase [Vibrio parahaemolyticus]ODX75754.1 DNA (cytosine-5-)-methyltransferase [Vibrio parahaemolyticus]